MAKHILIAGMSGAGKTALGKHLVDHYLRHYKRKSIVLSPKLDRHEWNTKHFFNDKDKFLWTAQNSINCLLPMDEPEQTIGPCNKASEKEYLWPTTLSREWGHMAILMTQRPQQVNLTMRSQCPTKYIFAQEYSDAEMFAKQYGKVMMETTRFKPFEFFYIRDNFTPPVKMKWTPPWQKN